MTLDAFHASLTQPTPPVSLSPELQALWLDANGEWDAAHSIVQAMQTFDAMWVHAYLHREEGVIWNAEYWYSRVGKYLPEVSLEEEWEQIATTLLSAQ
ncbi:hypothetical protein GF339_11670 [candidate division KSB3 bacterium]|uniref:Uncharacterized protein n=1 Tax=candidate division KSB3 bacterium TaxID=2044937 RepID=A0A9D5JWH1_9BACT|nr:hypothetical protein [candidate division KSB3 bacterium]MBD3325236.1 hypothetical protein [candidate division KSB3 bacterium]